MTKFKFDLCFDSEDIEKSAKGLITERLIASARETVRSLLHDGGYGRPEGAAHQIIRNKIEDYVLSDDFSNKVDEIIVSMVDESAKLAVEALMRSKARKHLFRPSSPVEEERGIES